MKSCRKSLLVALKAEYAASHAERLIGQDAGSQFACPILNIDKVRSRWKGTFSLFEHSLDAKDYSQMASYGASVGNRRIPFPKTLVFFPYARPNCKISACKTWGGWTSVITVEDRCMFFWRRIYRARDAVCSFLSEGSSCTHCSGSFCIACDGG